MALLRARRCFLLAAVLLGGACNLSPVEDLPSAGGRGPEPPDNNHGPGAPGADGSGGTSGDPDGSGGGDGVGGSSWNGDGLEPGGAAGAVGEDDVGEDD